MQFYLLHKNRILNKKVYFVNLFTNRLTHNFEWCYLVGATARRKTNYIAITFLLVFATLMFIKS